MEHIGWKGQLDDVNNQQFSKIEEEMEITEIHVSGWSIVQILQVDPYICAIKRDEGSSGIKIRGRKPSSLPHCGGGLEKCDCFMSLPGDLLLHVHASLWVSQALLNWTIFEYTLE
jgi:hypothetical protein